MDYIILHSTFFYCQPAAQRISQSASEVASSLQEAEVRKFVRGAGSLVPCSQVLAVVER